MNINKINGYTLVELMITVAIVSVLIAVSLPAFQGTISSMITNSQAKSLLSSLNYARSEAVKRGINTTICSSNNGTACNGTWNDGWIVFVDGAGNAGTVDAGDVVLQVSDPLSSGSTLTFTTNILQYNSRGFGLDGALQTFLICPADNDATDARSVAVSVSGRARMIDAGLACP